MSQIPARQATRSTANAIAKATLAWSLGKALSAAWWETTTVCIGWSTKGRSWYQILPRTTLATIASTADAAAPAVASFSVGEPPGRANSQSTAAAAATTKI